MRGAMKGMAAAAIAAALWFVLAGAAFAQDDRVWYQDQCPSLQQTTLPDTVAYLSKVVPDKGNAICVTYAMEKIESSHYQPAAAALVRLLDFRRPDVPHHGLTEPTTGLPLDIYPAKGVLPLLGTSALPALLQVILAESTSPVALTNALQDWITIYGPEHGGDAIARLAQEGMKSNPRAMEGKLHGILLQALGWCVVIDPDVSQIAACQQAAMTGTVPGKSAMDPQ